MSWGRIVSPDLRDVGEMIQPLAAAKGLRTLITHAASARIARDVVVVA